MGVGFRNVEADPAAPVETWPYEALVAAVERGGIREWARIVSAIARDPWGLVARQLEERLEYDRPYGVAPLLERAIASARAEAVRSERAAVAAEIGELASRSGLSLAALAERIGTSRTRLSTYRSGAVVPSAALLVRLRRLVERLESERATNSEPWSVAG